MWYFANTVTYDTQQCGFDFIHIWYKNRIFFFFKLWNKMENKKSLTVGTVPKSYRSVQMYVIFWYSRCGFDCFFFNLFTIFFSCHELIYFFSLPCQRQCELLPSLGVRRLIRLLFTFYSSPLKTLSQMNWNLVGSIYGRSSLKSAHFVIIHYQTCPPQAILVSDF